MHQGLLLALALVDVFSLVGTSPTSKALI